jgi:hypothetical protein
VVAATFFGQDECLERLDLAIFAKNGVVMSLLFVLLPSALVLAIAYRI